MTSSGKKPGFGDLDENQDYFHYDDYSAEVKELEGGDKTATDALADNNVAILVLSMVGAIVAVIGVVAFATHRNGLASRLQKYPVGIVM